MTQNKLALAVHGGAGTILRAEMTAELEAEYRYGLESALRAGWEVLQLNGHALDAVEAATIALENFPLFNAGRGAVFTHEGRNELDAAVMNGENLKAGAVAFVRNIVNPVSLARLVMEETEHILLAGSGANEFAKQMNVETADDAYFFTEHRFEQLEKARAAGVVQLDHATEEIADSKFQIPDSEKQKPIGTVGAVACDALGNVAAATSTGGMTNKKFGRVGDTPIIGAGTYADNQTCAVSCTGHGEFFMRGVTAYDIAARMKYKNLSLTEAAEETLAHLTQIGGEGGFIAVDRHANVVMPFNSDGMYRAFLNSDDEFAIEIYK